MKKILLFTIALTHYSFAMDVADIKLDYFISVVNTSNSDAIFTIVPKSLAVLERNTVSVKRKRSEILGKLDDIASLSFSGTSMTSLTQYISPADFESESTGHNHLLIIIGDNGYSPYWSVKIKEDQIGFDTDVGFFENLIVD